MQQNILPPQLKFIYAHKKVMCKCECCIYAKIMHYYLLKCIDNYLEELKDHRHNYQNSRSDEMNSRIFVTYNIDVMTHSFHITKTVTDMAMTAMRNFPSDQHDLSICKYVSCCCAKFKSFMIPN